jgi:phosphatidylglycerol---prolipoprotein diacylglyceryl transferase
MIIIGLDPIILQTRFFSIGWYGLMIGLGVLALIVVTYREVRRRGLDPEFVISAVIWCNIGGLLGARLFHVADNLGYYAAHPSQILTVQLDGLAFYGALAGGLVAAIIYAWIRRFPILKFLDSAALGIPIAQAIGRIGCTINGDSFGVPTNGSWGIVYTHPNALAPLGVPTQPTTLYEIVWSLLAFGLLWKLRDRVRSDGVLFFLYVGLYSLGRFFISFWRVNNYVFLGLREAQVLALIGLAIAIPVTVYLLKFRRRIRLVEEPSAA